MTTRIETVWPTLRGPRNRETARAAQLDAIAAAIGYLAGARKGSCPLWIGSRALPASASSFVLDVPIGPLDGLAIVRAELYTAKPIAMSCTASASTGIGSDSQTWQTSYGRQSLDLLVPIGAGSEVEPGSIELTLTFTPASAGLYLQGLSLVRLPLTPPWGAGVV